MNDPLRRIVIAVFLLAAWPLAASCVSVSKSYPEKRHFALDVAPPNNHATSTSGVILKIGRFRISPLYQGRELVYRTGELQYEPDFYDEWFILPAGMVTQQFENWLAATGLFQHVVPATSRTEPTYILEGAIVALYGDYRSSTAPKAVLVIELFLIDGVTDSDIRFKRTYREEITLADRSPETLTGGYNEALRRILDTFTEDLAAVALRPKAK
jgi:cholesterol transport system auxiliary component